MEGLKNRFLVVLDYFPFLPYPFSFPFILNKYFVVWSKIKKKCSFLCDAVLNLLICCYINHAVWFVHCRALHTMFYIFGSILHLCVRTNGIPLKVWPLAPINSERPLLLEVENCNCLYETTIPSLVVSYLLLYFLVASLPLRSALCRRMFDLIKDSVTFGNCASDAGKNRRMIDGITIYDCLATLSDS